MKKIFYLITLSFCIASLQLSAQSEYRILLHNGAIAPASNLQSFINEAKPSVDEIFAGYYYRFIQFNSIPDSKQRTALAATGIKLLDYIPHNAYMAAIPVALDKAQLNSLNIRCIIAQQPNQKINRNILGSFPDYAVIEKGTVDVIVQYQQNIAEELVLIAAAKLGRIREVSTTNHTISLRIADNLIPKIAQQSWVFYMDAATPPSTPDDTKGRSLHRSNFINSNYATGLHYDGAGVVIGLADDGEVGPHIDFTGRLTDHAGTGPGGTHGDMTSGIAMGAGNLNPVIRGMATGADIHIYNIGSYPHIVNSVNNFNTLGTVITSTSYSQSCNTYSTDTQFGDGTIYSNPQLEFVFSAGNNGTGSTAGDCGYGAGLPWATITGGYKQGKNVIACGNLDEIDGLVASSSRGPASDGRIKPDICTNGGSQLSTDEGNTYQTGSGTSAACPGMAGICAQVYQAYKDLNGGNNPESPLIKACFLNTAEDLGNPGPDYFYGWGRVNARRAVATLQDVRYLLDSVDQGNTKTHTIAVPANVSQLRVMLYWLDPAGSPASSQHLVNDLNMQVTDPTAVNFNPWVLDPTPAAANLSANAVRGVDNLNNMEQVTIDAPAAGNYIVTVLGNAVTTPLQRYYIVYEFRTDTITLTYPNGGEGFVPGEQEIIRWDAPKGVGSFILQYSTNAGATWNNIATVNSALLQYTWNVPDSVTGEASFRVTNGISSDVSDTLFTIIRTPQNINIDWACLDTTHLIWNAVPGAIGYEVYKLGAKYMNPIGTTTTNEFFAAGINPANEYWFSVSAISPNGSKGRRAYAINKQPGTFNCPLAIDAQLSSLTPQGSYRTCQNNNAIAVSILLENYGQNPLTNVPVNYSLDGAPAVNETYTGTIAPFSSVVYNFTATLNLSTIGVHTLQAWCSYVGDLNTFNDTLSTSLKVIAGINATLPVTENFDLFTLCSTASNCSTTVCALPNGWVNEANGEEDEIDFRTSAGSTPSLNTGPNVDHTTGTANGKYLYLEASGPCFARTALLTSPCLDLNLLPTAQLSFWYHMFGASMGELHLDIFSGGNWTLDVMPPITGNQGNTWQQRVVSLTPFANQIVNIRFRGITGNNTTSDLAIDDINVDINASLNQHEFAGNVVVYPNPSSGLFNIVMNGLKSEKLKLQVYNLEGKLLKQNSVQVANSYKTTLDMSAYSKGIYFLEIKGTDGVKRFKLTVL